MARAVQKVAQRCEEATENETGLLDLSECQLIQVPDALYFLLRNANITICNLSSNSLKKLPIKFAETFTTIKELKLHGNKISTLPNELCDCLDLEIVDISNNLFEQVPSSLFKLPKIKSLLLSKNSITDVEDALLESCPSLQILDLQDNPLSEECQTRLKKSFPSKVKIT